eukprot:scpid83650/ scgid34174/ 
MQGQDAYIEDVEFDGDCRTSNGAGSPGYHCRLHGSQYVWLTDSCRCRRQFRGQHCETYVHDEPVSTDDFRCDFDHGHACGMTVLGQGEVIPARRSQCHFCPLVDASDYGHGSLFSTGNQDSWGGLGVNFGQAAGSACSIEAVHYRTKDQQHVGQKGVWDYSLGSWQPEERRVQYGRTTAGWETFDGARAMRFATRSPPIAGDTLLFRRDSSVRSHFIDELRFLNCSIQPPPGASCLNGGTAV